VVGGFRVLRKPVWTLLFLVILIGAGVYLYFSHFEGISDYDETQILPDLLENGFDDNIEIERILSGHDEDGDGIDDLEDIVLGAREEVKRKPVCYYFR
jgi:hypothetical protein